MSIERYVLVDKNDNESDEYDDYQEALSQCDEEHAIVARRYEFADSELLYTPDGGSTWPPKKRERRSDSSSSRSTEA